MVVALIAAAIVAVPSGRESVLRSVGRTLVIDEPVTPADIIVVSPDSGGPGALEAADLVQSGIAARVAVFIDPPSSEDYEYVRRGLPYENAGARQMPQLKWLGVNEVLQILRTNVGTGGVGEALPQWSDENKFRTIIFVAARDHTRRLRRVLDRSMNGRQTRVAVRPSRYSSFDPDKWWISPSGIRTVLFELQKLMLDIVQHPI